MPSTSSAVPDVYERMIHDARGALTPGPAKAGNYTNAEVPATATNAEPSAMPGYTMLIWLQTLSVPLFTPP